jgi:hypothetical protein
MIVEVLGSAASASVAADGQQGRRTRKGAWGVKETMRICCGRRESLFRRREA